jgi:hypothetical protein
MHSHSSTTLFTFSTIRKLFHQQLDSPKNMVRTRGKDQVWQRHLDWMSLIILAAALALWCLALSCTIKTSVMSSPWGFHLMPGLTGFLRRLQYEALWFPWPCFTPQVDLVDARRVSAQFWGFGEQKWHFSLFALLHHVALVRTDVSEELGASIIRVTRIGELGTLAITSNRRTLVTAHIVPSSLILVPLIIEAPSSSETSVLTSATWCNIPEDGILYSHCHKNLKSYIFLVVQNFL